ncbi:MAG: Sulfite reductase, assimilatory-type (EC 1.8.-.-) [Olavius algarvensis Delta 4 endosymbiont]|nr:MAG: Sulfite reductase, assimilatory-type (EC 1.8.-.-) [Olavius algarvensis Delta 4 endosymbiont]
MLKLGEKGAILQRDKKTYAIAPHIPCGLVTPELLRRVANVAEKYEVDLIKITGATRFALVGLKEQDIDAVWDDLGVDKGAAVGLCVRSIRTCPGIEYCRLAVQDALNLGLKLDETYHGMQLPNKLKMAVSGCNLNCSESVVRDIGLVGKADGWTLMIGGNVGPRPRLAVDLTSGLTDEATLALIARLVEFYRENGKRGERLGKMIERVGLEPFREVL